MRSPILQFLLPTGTVGPLGYFLVGIILFAIKFPLDWLIARAHAIRWTPLSYLIWPGHDTLVLWRLPPLERSFVFDMLAFALPFVWIGVSFTIRRLRDARLPTALAVLFFVPLINVALMLALCLVPSRAPLPTPPEIAPGRAAELMTKLSGDRTWVAFVVACLVSAAIGVGLTAIVTAGLHSYGLGAFVAMPVLLGATSTLLFALPKRRSLGQCIAASLVAPGIACIALIGVGLEGAICILLASPLIAVLSFVGGAIGWAAQRGFHDTGAAVTLLLLMACVVPVLMAAESATPPAPRLRSVVTSVIVGASPERVWAHVIEFPPLAPPDEWLFTLGVAYPMRAEIHGHGCGATRHCVFSTGTFVEPIDVWDEPNRLAFSVTEQPAPMVEFSPFDIHPPHLDGFLESRRGEFRLEAQADGSTLLIGTTWYVNRMWPSAYWELWSDSVIHSIHERVLEHIRALAENGYSLR